MADNPSYGQLIDGYISGATVFADANHNGVLDSGEASSITDALGRFFLQNASGPLVAVGGVDTSTKQPVTVTLEAPAGSTVITPLTTLINALLPQNATSSDVAAAEATVVKGLGISLSAGQSLLTLDPVAGTINGDAAATAAYVAGAKILDTISVLSAGLSNQAGVSSDVATSSVAAALADKINAAASSGQTVDLASTATLQQVVTSAATNAGTSVSTSAASSISNIAAASNAAIDTTASQATNGQALFVGTSAVQQVATGSTIAAIVNTPSGQSLTSVETQYTGSNLTGAVNDAKSNVSTPAESATSGKLLINLSGDQFQGNPDFQVYVDGKLVTGNLSAIGGSGTSSETGVSASHAQGQWQTFTVNGTYDTTTSHTISVSFTNDAYGGSLSADRNLYIGNITLAGQAVIGSTNDVPTELYNNSSQSYDTSIAGSVKPLTSGTDTLTIQLSGDHYVDNPHFLVYVDGNLVQGSLSGIGGSGTSSDTGVSASYAKNEWQTYTVKGNFDANGAHKVQVVFNNDLYGGSATADQNLYVGNVAVNGKAIAGSTNDHPAALYVNGAQTYDTSISGTPATPATGPDKLTIHFSGDQYLGNPDFLVYVDGKLVTGQLSGVGDAGPATEKGVSASHAQGQWQTYTVNGNFDPTVEHKIDVVFNNDLYQGSPSSDRNLYIGKVTLDGQTISGSSDANPTEMLKGGTFSFSSTATTAGGGDTMAGGTGGSVDTMPGGSSGGSDTLTGGVPHSMISGGPGTLYVGSGGDTLYGGLSAGAHDTLTAGSGDNLLSVKYGDNVLYANSGLDTLQGGSGHDTLYGGGSSALYAGSGGDTLYGGLTASAHDTLTSGAGNDYLWVSQGNNVLFGGAGLDTLQGGAGHDTLYGGGQSAMFAGSGGDTLYGGLGSGAHDTLMGGAGNDYLSVTQGNNALHATGGMDTLHAGSGNDTLYAGFGDAKLYGGSGHTTFEITGTTGNDTIVGGSGFSSVIIDGHSSTDAHYEANNDGSTTITFTGTSQSITTTNIDTLHYSADNIDHKIS